MLRSLGWTWDEAMRIRTYVILELEGQFTKRFIIKKIIEYKLSHVFLNMQAILICLNLD